MRPSYLNCVKSQLQRQAVVLLVVGLWLSLAAGSGCFAAQVAKLDGRTMGTTWHAVLEFNGDDYNSGDFEEQIEVRLAEINRLMSTYDPESELSRFNASQSTDWFAVSPETAVVIAAALEVAKKSNGQFDPTVGPLVNLWGFGPDGRRKEPPSDEQIAAARGKVGYQQVEARLDPPAIRKSSPGVYLDLSAIAKGYGSDAVVETLRNSDDGKAFVEAAMVEIGGEIRTYGTKSTGQPWRLGIERPDSEFQMVHQIVAIDNGDALATSGDYRNFFADHGHRYSHTIDPATGRPVTHKLASVTVRTPTCMEADALATALTVMGPEKGLAWATEHKIAAVLVERTDDGFRELVTPAWAKIDGNSTKVTSTSAKGNSMLVYAVISLLVFGVALAGMAIGVILSNRRLKGTCGGIAGLTDTSGKTACELCTNPSPTCGGKNNAESHEHAEAH
ncbi:FAD:protein FMN transferase [Aeoliella sp. SH292]|uniref:FAD:protein FMN transferase n=1 Tax=Aeoliella sp. SH292 TaxID=3454464 RepID=UPI003F99E4E5